MVKPEVLVSIVLVLIAFVLFVNSKSGIDFGLSKITGSGRVLVKNFVNVTIIEADCTQCGEPTLLLRDLVDAGLNVSKVDFVYQNQSESLVNRYSITKLPALIFSSNLTKYGFYNYFSYYGTLESDGNFVFRSVNPPYYDLGSDLIVEGGVTAYLISYSNCTNCYNPTAHLQILAGFEVIIKEELEVNESSDLVEKYNITKLPTIVLSPEAQLYKSLMRVWPSVGSVESDGYLVFRDMSALGAVNYYDLTLGSEVSQ